VSAFNTWQRASLPSVAFVHSAKSWRWQAGLTVGQNLPSVRRWYSAKKVCLSTWQRGRLCQVLKLSTRQRPALPRIVSLSSVRVWALGKGLGKDNLYRVPKIKNSAKLLVLGKACDSGSDIFQDTSTRRAPSRTSVGTGKFLKMGKTCWIYT